MSWNNDDMISTVAHERTHRSTRLEEQGTIVRFPMGDRTRPCAVCLLGQIARSFQTLVRYSFCWAFARGCHRLPSLARRIVLATLIQELVKLLLAARFGGPPARYNRQYIPNRYAREIFWNERAKIIRAIDVSLNKTRALLHVQQHATRLRHPNELGD